MEGIESFVVNNAMSNAVEERLSAIKEVLADAQPATMRGVAEWLNAMVEGASLDEFPTLRRMLLEQDDPLWGEIPMSDDDVLAENWSSGAYPYQNLMSRKKIRVAEVSTSGGAAQTAGLDQEHRAARRHPLRGA